MIGGIRRAERSILSVLQPFTGTRSSGTALAIATGGDVFIPPDPPTHPPGQTPQLVRPAYLMPVFASAAGVTQIEPQRLIKTAIGPDLLTVTGAGMSVPVQSMLGGAANNLPAGTLLRWDPPIEGLEPFAEVEAPGLAGGADASGRPLARHVSVMESMGGSAQEELARGKVAACPAIIVLWTGGVSEEVRGAGRTGRALRFRIYVVTSRMEGVDERADEGKELLDAIACELGRRSSVDNEIFSAPPVKLGAAGRMQVAATSYIYWQEIDVHDTVIRTERRVFSTWLTSAEMLQADQPDADDRDPLTLVDQEQEMPQD